MIGESPILCLMVWVNVGQLVDYISLAAMSGSRQSKQRGVLTESPSTAVVLLICYDAHTHAHTDTHTHNGWTPSLPRSTLSIFIYLKSMSAPKFSFEVYWKHEPVSDIRVHAAPPFAHPLRLRPYVYVGPCGWCSYHHYPSRYPHVHILITPSMSSAISGAAESLVDLFGLFTETTQRDQLEFSQRSPPGQDYWLLHAVAGSNKCKSDYRE